MHRRAEGSSRRSGAALIASPAKYGKIYGMPSTTKATYSLDPATLEKLNRLSHRWQVSKTEVLRRALHQAAETAAPSTEERLAALDALQRWAKEKRIDLGKWKKTIKDGRR
jgi:predicted transcriptional regulator